MLDRDNDAALVQEAAGLLGVTLDSDVIYDTLQAIVARAMDCASLLVSVYTPEDNLIRCAYAWVDGSRLDLAPFPPVPLAEEGQGVQSRVIRSGEALIVPDAIASERSQVTRFYAHDDGSVTDQPHPDKPRVRSLIAVPIRLDGRVLGAAQVMSHRQDAYTDGHRLLLESLLIQVAAATRSAFLFGRLKAELAERERVEAENARLLQEAREAAIRQRFFLRDVLASVTEGRLRLCDTPDDLPLPLTPFAEPVPLSLSGGLRELRRQSLEAAGLAGLPEERGYDLELAVGEAGMNAVVHAGTGTGCVFWGKGAVQVRIEDQGEGITVENLPRATLARGFSTKATLGHGMKMMLQTASRLWLLTSPAGTTVVLEQTPDVPETSWLGNKRLPARSPGYFNTNLTAKGANSMANEDVVEGKIKQAEGKAQDAVGDITGSTDDDVAGKAKQVEGKAQELFGKAKEAVHDATK